MPSSTKHLETAREAGAGSGHSRNGYSRKTMQTEDVQFELNTPRDRNSEFELQLAKKHQRQFTTMDVRDCRRLQ